MRIVVAMITTCAWLAASDSNATAVTVPAWLFPMSLPPGVTPVFDRVKPLHVPRSRVTFTEAQLNDLFSAPDWFPPSHSAMPEVVARGRAPDVYACGFCHTPGGQGRPENASLAGLPAAYIVQQVADFKSGARRSAWPGAYRPADRMIEVAAHATPEDVASAATYFSQQNFVSHVRVLERARVPSARAVGWVYAAIPGGGGERLGERLMEFAPDPIRHEHRDESQRYVAYVPLGSVARGKTIARSGAGSLAVACVACHGKDLQGMALFPRLAGRSPTYLMRQLLAFKTGARAGPVGQPMRAVVDNLSVGDMVAVAAYAASLEP